MALNNKRLVKNFFANLLGSIDLPTSEIDSKMNLAIERLITQFLGQNIEPSQLLAADLLMFTHKPDSLALAIKPQPSLQANKFMAGNLSPGDLNPRRSAWPPIASPRSL